MKDEESGGDPSWRLLGFRGTQNRQFSIGFIRSGDMAECHVIYRGKPNAFLMLFEVIFTFWFNFYAFSIGFIRYFLCFFRKLKN